ncbi:hypothetical protein [Segetibacter aerophilus]|uniref:Uncharacterized protein n=1 Tax=Segetibacter aerophilus TaxID=670293 RepID=A0A512BJD4_9BACT|nr:hypothetical protein [Segetibacter aerophilus]GEO12081.1 hypothetical protein SAE01_45770 [Segetibacter aerophilus]
MKAYLVILTSAFVGSIHAQSRDTTLPKERLTPDSIARPFIISSPRYAFDFNTHKKYEAQPKSPDQKIKLYWDPVYQRLVPFQIHTGYKDTWFSNAANTAVQFLTPYKKVER